MSIGNFADTNGRRPAFVACITIFLIANIGLATQSHFGAFLFLRCLQSIGGSSSLSLSTGVVADLAPPSKRGTYIGFVTAGSVLGPAFGPVLGGLLSEHKGWRSIFWFLTVFAAVFIAHVVPFYPETARAVVGDGSLPPQKWNRTILSCIRERKADRSYATSQKLRFPNPLPSLAISCQKETCIILFSSAIICVGIYVISALIPTSFMEAYDLTDMHVGLVYVAFGTGSGCGSCCAGRIADMNFRRIASKVGHCDVRHLPLEEARVQVALPFAVIGCCAVMGLGWSLHAKAHLAVPLVFLFIIGTSISASWSALNTLVTDLHPDQASTAASANNLFRCSIGAAAVGPSDRMLRALGPGWYFTLTGALMLLLSTPMVVAVLLWGFQWRKDRRILEEAKEKEQKSINVERWWKRLEAPRIQGRSFPYMRRDNQVNRANTYGSNFST